ncbi:conserved hypothetical protein [Parvibaculum lavamentivorans DS-1]|uniref:Damage-inducible mutagenesis protein n=2 Tax=Parvibaculum lavamentivorans TaxID=256618 RepID=A7HW53_PARL1|nr:conserved hypothetical protein [Parvibaculum lavamentivorans DS-1]
MSQAAKAALIADLKSRIASPLSIGGDGCAAMSLGDAKIDRMLPDGGLRLGALHEIVAATYHDTGAVGGFLAGLAVCVMSRSTAPILWCDAGRSPFDMGRLYGPGIAAFGLDPARLILVAPPRDSDCLWVMEEALRSHAFAAVVGEVESSSASLDLTATRRLQLAAEEAKIPVFLSTGCRKAAGGASAAVTRWQVKAAPSAPVSYADEKERLPGIPRWEVDLVRSRGGQPGHWLVEWSGAANLFSVIDAEETHRAKPGLVAGYANVEALVPLRRMG